MTYERSGLTARQFFDVWETSTRAAGVARRNPSLVVNAVAIVRLDIATRHGDDAATKAVAYYERLMHDARRLP